MSSAISCNTSSRSEGNRRCRLKQEEDEEGRRQWRRAGKEPGGSGRVKEVPTEPADICPPYFFPSTKSTPTPLLLYSVQFLPVFQVPSHPLFWLLSPPSLIIIIALSSYALMSNLTCQVSPASVLLCVQQLHLWLSIRAARYWKKLTLQFFLTVRYILQYEKIQAFSSDDLNSTLCYAAFQNDKHLYFIWTHSCVLAPSQNFGQFHPSCSWNNSMMTDFAFLFGTKSSFSQFFLVGCLFFNVVTSDSLHAQGLVWRTKYSVCQVPLKLDELICVLHRRFCNVTIAHT